MPPKPSTHFEKRLAEYDYSYPESAVALEPAEPRDSARLLVVDPASGKETQAIFRDLPRHLPPRSLLVMNETKVIPARLEVEKPSGGRVRLLYVADAGKRQFRALGDRALESGITLSVAGKPAFTVIARAEDGGYLLAPAKPSITPLALFMKYGKTPIPPYLKHTGLSEPELRKKYQTVFAAHAGSVAAPTASLHFTKKLLADLKRAGHEIVFVTLHVNLGTFAPLTPKALKSKTLHSEYYEVPAATRTAIRRAKAAGRPVIPVGTTALRAIESAAGGRGAGTGKASGETTIFISPGYRFRVADGLITNFHVPRSSLMMLVAALTGRKALLGIYERAIRAGFKIFSFGDGMLVLPRRASAYPESPWHKKKNNAHDNRRGH